MNKNEIDGSSRILKSSLGEGAEVRENCTIHDSTVGEKCRIFEKVSLKKVLLADHVVINAGSYLEYVEVEEDVLIGPNCSIVGVFHQIFETGVEWADSWKRVIIRKKVFIGAGSVILPGVEIGESSVIGAGSVVTKSIPAFHICFGTPPNQTIMSLKKWLGSIEEINSGR
ncbi:MAG: acyltransferase [Candidatus Nealsonbacteria bacterium]|nr:acyltransferase [Candidatus Nealsonbacteria bacterium]